MIRIHANEFTPGSLPPRFVKDVGRYTLPAPTMEAIDSYVDASAWEHGMNFLIVGGAMAGKTSTGLYLMRSIFKARPDTNVVYWTEADYHADLRNLWRYEGLVEKSANDAPLWGEYTEWERGFWDLKESTLLFLDDLGRGKTPNQRYEIETMLRRRRDMGLGTIAAATTADWGAMPASVQALFAEGMTIQLQGDVVHAGR